MRGRRGRGRIVASRVRRRRPEGRRAGSLYNLAADPRLNHEIAVRAGVRADESAALLREFFAARRADGSRERRHRPRALERILVTMPGGGMRERPNRMVSKTIVAQVTVGSNPTPSAT